MLNLKSKTISQNSVTTIMEARKSLITIGVVTLIALLYVNQQALIYQMGLQVKENSYMYSKLFDRNKILVYNVLNLKSPSSLEAKLLAREVKLDRPRKWQVVKVEDSTVKVAQDKVEKRSLFARLFTAGREVEASQSRSSKGI